MKKIFLSLLVTAFAFSSVTAITKHETINDCILSFDNLIAVTSSATSLTVKEQGGLVKIATDARNLYSIGKTMDALQKLYNYQTKLDQLATTLNNPDPKISPSDEQALRIALNETIACVSGTWK